MVLSGIAGVAALKLRNPHQLNEATGRIEKFDPDLIMSYVDSQCEPTTKYLKAIREAALDGKTVLHFADQHPGHHRTSWLCEELPWYDGRGNISFATNDKGSCQDH